MSASCSCSLPWEVTNMQILRLSIANFKRNIRFYLSYILSLSFSAFILYDFLALMDSGLLEKRIRSSVI